MRNSPEVLYKSPIPGQGGVSSLVTGLSTEPGQKFDQLLVESLTDHLFRDGPSDINPEPQGFDLAALNIARGRDHGLKGKSTVIALANAPFKS